MVENTKINYIFVDMDGVLADFLKGCEAYIGHPMTNDDKGHSDYDKRKEELTNKRMFANLPPMVDMYDLIAYIKHTGLPWEVLTAAGVVNRDLVVYDKKAWTAKWVDPNVVVNCTFTGSQKAVYAMPGNVLIDDRPKNIKAWEEAGGIGILHTCARDTIIELKKLRNMGVTPIRSKATRI